MSYHRIIINKFKELGYKDISDGGVCAGLTSMWLQACLINKSKTKPTEEEKFFQRIKLLIDTDNISDRIEEAKDKVKSKKELSEFDQRMLDVAAMMDSIYVYHMPHLHTEVFGKPLAQSHTEEVSYFAKSITLEKELKEINQEEITRIHCETPFLDKKQLQTYFDKLRKILLQAGAGEETTITIGSGLHRFGLRLKDNHWMLFDPNNIEENIENKQQFITDDTIGFYVSNAMHPVILPNEILFNINIYASPALIASNKIEELNNSLHEFKSNNSQFIPPMAAEIQEHRDYSEHNKLPEKMTIAGLASRFGDLETLEHLVDLEKTGAQTHLTDHETLKYGCQNYRPEIVKLLIENTDLKYLGKQIDEKMTVIHSIVKHGDIRALELLVNRSPDCLESLTLPYGYNALHVAIMEQQPAIISALIKMDKKICTLLDGRGDSPIHMAAKVNNASVLSEFKKNNIDLNLANPFTKLTPLDIALRNKNWDASLFLLTSLKYTDLNSKTKKLINENIKSIEEAFLNHIQSIESPVDKETEIDAIIQKSNALGGMLNKIKIQSGVKFFNPQKINGINVSENVFRLVKSCYETEPKITSPEAQL